MIVIVWYILQTSVVFHSFSHGKQVSTSAGPVDYNAYSDPGSHFAAV